MRVRPSQLNTAAAFKTGDRSQKSIRMPDWPNYLNAEEQRQLAEIDDRLAADKRLRRTLMNRAKQRKHVSKHKA